MFGNERIDYVTGNREFIGEEGLSWLIEHNIKAILRIKKDAIIETATEIKSIKHRLENDPCSWYGALFRADDCMGGKPFVLKPKSLQRKALSLF
ncbi:hypothetical protein [Candidatus Albibeggiatoa sp. nov. BB20]|uniref:hypothetical protein n=1 Tax=Candidatus Albibeggiatoa sp. nov. BB20 TaxID=3162723 RepID=UPI0033655C46